MQIAAACFYDDVALVQQKEMKHEHIGSYLCTSNNATVLSVVRGQQGADCACCIRNWCQSCWCSESWHHHAQPVIVIMDPEVYNELIVSSFASVVACRCMTGVCHGLCMITRTEQVISVKVTSDVYSMRNMIVCRS